MAATEGKGAGMRQISKRNSVALTTSAATTPEIPFDGFTMGMVYIPTGSLVATFTYYAARELGGTYVPVYTSADVALVRNVSSPAAFALPDECSGAGAIRIVSDVAVTVDITLKP